MIPMQGQVELVKFERHKGAANRMVNMIDGMSLRMKLSWYNNL